MELEDVQSDLHSLRKLYGLLQTQNASSDNLDEKARVLLKNLLDSATERTLKTHSKIIAAESAGLSSLYSTQSVQPTSIRRLKPPVSVSPDTLNTSQCVIQNQNSSKDLNCSKFSLQKGQQSLAKPIPHNIVLEHSENRLKFCDFHNQSSLKQQNSAKEVQNRKDESKKDISDYVQFGQFEFKAKASEPLRGNEKLRQKRNREIHSPRTVELRGKIEEMDYISREVADTIKEIESRLPDVKQTDQALVQPRYKNAAQQLLPDKITNSVSIADTVIDKKKRLVSRGELSQAGKFRTSVQKMSQIPRQNIAKKSDLMNRLASPVPNTIQGFRISPSHKETHIQKENSNQNQLTTLRSSSSRKMQAVHVDQKFSQIRAREKNLRTQMTKKSSQTRRTITRYHQQRSDQTSASSQHSSSSWTTQQTNTNSRDCPRVPGDSMMTRLKTDQPGNQIPAQKAVGRLRRLKNKLAIIFHHHHHHHHHHGDGGNTGTGHARSFWKKMIHPGRREGEKAVEKFRGQGRNHFHALVEGLLRHIRNRKKMRPAKGGIGGLGKKVTKKLHWWQRSDGRGGVKLPNRSRVKMGFTNRKLQVRGGKMS